jgi:predicted DNA-binding protein YlxM (UPF0122 family)
MTKISKTAINGFVLANSQQITKETVRAIKEIKTRILDYTGDLTLSEKQIILNRIQKEIARQLRETANDRLTENWAPIIPDIKPMYHNL